MHMIEPERFVLTDQDEGYYRMLQQAYALVFEELRESAAVRMIQSQVDGAETWHVANRILRDVYALFSPFVAKNKELRRAILLEKIYGMAKVAEGKAYGTREDADGVKHEWADQEWMELARRLYADAAKMEGLDQAEVAMLNPDDIVIPEIEITSDPEAFLEAQAGEALDWEDVIDDELDEQEEEAEEDEDD